MHALNDDDDGDDSNELNAVGGKEMALNRSNTQTRVVRKWREF